MAKRARRAGSVNSAKTTSSTCAHPGTRYSAPYPGWGALTAQPSGGEDVSFIFTTIARNDCVRRLVDSALSFYPALTILVADQNTPTAEMTAFYADRKVGVHWVPYDFGVSAGRAALARKVKTPFLLYGDDDFLFTGRTNLGPVIDFLASRPDVALVTGGMIDHVAGKDGGSRRKKRRYETYICRDLANKGLIIIPIDYVDAVVAVHRGEVFYKCDLGLNWAMARTSLFADERLLWDPQFKTAGEHENFFLQIKEFGGGQVMFYPGMECDHMPETNPDYEALRTREAGWEAFAKKWDVDWLLHVGTALHRFSDFYRPTMKTPLVQGSAPQLPPRFEDYLRLWADGSADASVSSRSLVAAAHEQVTGVRAKNKRHIANLRARIDSSEASNERMAKKLEELRAPGREVPELKQQKAESSAERAALLAAAAAKVRDLKQKVAGLVEERTMLRDKVRELLAVKKLNASLANERAGLRETVGTLLELKRQNATLADERARLREKVANLQAKVASVGAEQKRASSDGVAEETPSRGVDPA